MQLRTVVPFLAATLLLLSACTKSSSDGADSDDNSSGTPSRPGDSRSFTTDCGVVVNGSLKNPVDASSAELVSIASVVDGTTVIVQRAQGRQLVKLHGIGNNIPDYKQEAARSSLSRLPRSSVLLFEPGASCAVTVAGGGTGIVGQLISSAGVDYSEELLGKKLASVASTDPCGVSLLTSCYQALLDSAPATVIRDTGEFLWKPVSDSDGKLAVLVEPLNAIIFVNGEELRDIGPGNGRGSTGRGSKPGCAYGQNVRVQVIDRRTGGEYSVRGQNPVIIANGCQRTEIP